MKKYEKKQLVIETVESSVLCCAVQLFLGEVASD